MDRRTIESLEKHVRSNLINSLSGFKGLQLVGTKNSQAQMNLSIINSAHHLGAHPPLMGYIQRPHTVERQTYENILELKKYTFSNVTQSLQQQAHQTSARYPRDMSEFEACGIQIAMTDSGIPYAHESTIVIELTYLNSYPIEENDTILVVGSVDQIHISEELIFEDGTINLPAAKSVAGVGLNGYSKVDDLTRYSYAKPNKDLEIL